MVKAKKIKLKNRHVVYVYSRTWSTNRPTEIEVCNFFVFSSCLSLWKAGGVYRTWNTTTWNRHYFCTVFSQQSIVLTLHLPLAKLTQGGDTLILLTGSVFLVSGTKSYQYDVRRNRLLNVISTHSWGGCWQKWKNQSKNILSRDLK